MILGLLLLNTFLLACLVFVVRKLCKYVIYLSDVNYANSLLTECEQDELHKQRAFDERIQFLKEELASSTAANTLSNMSNSALSNTLSNTLNSTSNQTMRHGEPALELHPLVKNLPHDSVKIREEQLPDVEYAE